MRIPSETSRLSLECGERSVRLIQSRRQGARVLIEHCFESDWPDGNSFLDDPIAAGRWLKQQFDRRRSPIDWKSGNSATDFNTNRLPVTAVAPRESFMLKSISLPPESVDDVDDLVRYQAATHFCSRMGELAVGHLTAVRGAAELRSLMFAMPQATVQRWKSFCQAAHLNLTGIVPRSVAIAESLRRGLPDHDGGADELLIVRDENSDGLDIEICLLREHLLIQNVTVRLPDDSGQWPGALSGGVRRVISAMADSESVSLSQIVLLGDFPETLDGRLSQDTATTVIHSDLLRRAWFDPAIPVVKRARSTGLLADALSPGQSVNFLAGDHRTSAVTRSVRRRKFLLAASVLILVGLYGLNRVQNSQLDRAAADLIAQRRQVEQQLARGQADVQLVQLIDRWQQPRPGDQLSEFFNLIPPADEARLTGLELSVLPNADGLTIRANGIAARQESILQLNDRLLANTNYRLQPHGIEPVPSRHGTEYRFEVDVTIPSDSNEHVSANVKRNRRGSSRGYDLRLLQQELLDTKNELAGIQASRTRLWNFARQTLAASPAAATTQYHKVLLCLAEQHQLTDAVLTPHRPRPVDKRLLAIPFSIRVDTTLEQLQRFVAHFEQLTALHRITFLSIEPTTLTQNPRLQCRLQLETACIDLVGFDEHLNPTALFVSPLRETLVSHTGNPFAGPRVPMPIQTVSEPSPEPVQAAVLELVGVIDDGDQSEVWLFDRTTGRNHIVKLNGTIGHESLSGRLIGVDQDTAILQVPHDQIRLSIGQIIRPTTRMASASDQDRK